ncbi:hypothetical protein Ccrd_014487 [Cynara cardunculus var. scolymus]|uniref:SLH domain-containing protein n=1 Tax=Cynara cardunculus var. scolymus TaxID=59895 RepID=A0A103YDL7_CYNCS|nr:hypothetical protein Ccrd_014487 [Cynara cardunculus var. scolymus]
MSSCITTRSPTSYQLRLAALNCRKYPSPSVFLRMRGHKPDHQIRCFSFSRDNVTHQRTGSKFSLNAFSGWSGDDNDSEVLDESPPKKGWSGGIVGAAVAGVVLVAGLAFATLSVSKRVSGPKQNMETLTTHQEESLVSADQNDDVIEDEGTESETAFLDDSHLEDKTGRDDDSYSHEKENKTMTESELGQNTNKEDGEVMNNVSIQREFQEELPTDEVQGDSVETPKSNVHDDSFDASNIENLDDSLVAEKLESSNKLTENPIDFNIIESSVMDVKSENPDIDHQEVDAAINGLDKSTLPSPLITLLDSQSEQVAEKVSISSQSDVILEPQLAHEEDIESISSKKDDFGNSMLFPEREVSGGGLSIPVPESALPYTFASEQNHIDHNDNIRRTIFDSMDFEKLSSSASVPAPSLLSPALQAVPGKVLVPAVVDQVQGQALAALQVLKVIESDVHPGDLCTRREYARWLVSASRLAEAGLIASKLSRQDMDISNQDECPLYFGPQSPLSRQDLVSWKMSLEKRLLPVADRTILQRLSGFIDIDKINPDAWPALIADLSAGEQGIVGLAFGYTRLFQPDKPVTKSQAAIALATGEASDIVSEELARIEAESMAEKAVAAHSALVDQVQKDVNTYFEKDLLLEREKIVALEKIAEETKQELERLRAEQVEQNIKIMKDRAAVDSQMEVLSKLRHEAEEELQSIMSNKVEISYEKERLKKLRTDAETENQEISRLQYELEVERKALAMARSWAEDEAKRAREQAKVLEDARGRWESQGIKVIVDNDLRDEANAGPTWVSGQNQFSIEETKSRAENLVDKLKAMAADVKGKSRETIDKVIEKILFLISQLKEMASKAMRQMGEVKDGAVSKMSGSMQDLQQGSVGLVSAAKEGAKRVAGDCREGVEKLTQKFKT